ncbi:MAG: outer membrane lipoprotein-sorting protein [Candidatus Riflebacteria bacterium]|nr:outer membrane lipoprotein-sorting protein [Candidatus Riflebacteria bacterium]
MKSFFITIMLTVLCCSASAESPPLTEPELDAIALVRAVETQYQGENSHGIMLMSIKTQNWSRTLEIESWSEGRDKFLTKILAPVKERGACTLKVSNDIWNYIPRIDRLIKIPSSLMGDSWMGSHITNDDLVKENKIDMLYQLEITDRASDTITITGIPFPDAAVVWGKIVYQLELSRKIPLKIDFYDEDGKKIRVMEFSEIKQIDNRWLPMLFRILPLEKPDEFTEMRYKKINFSVSLPKNLFSIKNMRNR